MLTSSTTSSGRPAILIIIKSKKSDYFFQSGQFLLVRPLYHHLLYTGLALQFPVLKSCAYSLPTFKVTLQSFIPLQPTVGEGGGIEWLLRGPM